MDEEASEVAKKQDESDLSVRKLVDMSKEFKKNSTEVSQKKINIKMHGEIVGKEGTLFSDRNNSHH